MAGNREIIEVLHFIGADDHYIAGQFQSHFAILGVRGGLIGGAAAIVVLITIHLTGRLSAGLLEGASLSELAFPGLQIVGATMVVVALVGLIAGIASRMTVHRTIGRLA